jgi:hypothetical protein
MVSKDVALDLRKFKLAAGQTKTPSKRSKSKGDDGRDSPTTVRFANDRSKGRGKSNDNRNPHEEYAFNNQMRKLIRDLDNGVADKISLMKMLVIKGDEADRNFNRLRSCLNDGQADAVDR